MTGTFFPKGGPTAPRADEIENPAGFVSAGFLHVGRATGSRSSVRAAAKSMRPCWCLPTKSRLVESLGSKCIQEGETSLNAPPVVPLLVNCVEAMDLIKEVSV